MADLPSILGGMAQGFVDLGKSAVDMFGTGGAAIGDLIESARTGKVTTKNQDDFRKWLYQTDDTKDAAAKGLGTALNGVQTSLDYIPGVNVLTHNPLGNAAQGALGGLADEFKTYGADYDLGRAGQRAAISGAAAAASGSLADALKGSSNALLSSNAVQGLARGATSGAISAGGYAAIDGGDVLEAAKQGAGMGALIGGATGAFQDFKPARTYDVALTDDERQARLANIDDQLSRLDTSTPEGGARYSELMSAQDNYLPKPRMMDNTGQAVPQELVERLANTSPLVRDENGNLMRFYHGTPDGSFDTFRDGSYFTPDRTYADIYQNPQASSISYGKQAVNPTTFETYLDIRKPFDISDPEARRVYIDEYIKGGNAMGINPYQDNYDDIKNIDWTEVENLSEFLRDGKYGYDALIADEGGVFDSAGNVVPRGKSYIPFSGDQVVTLKKNSGISPETTKKLEKILSASEDAVNNPRYLTDENGNPRTFYHGSPNKNITEFDINQAGKNTSSGEHALYFTDSPQVADDFSYERLPGDSMFIENKGAKGRVYPVNLEMNNPLDLDNLSDAQIRELWEYASPLGQLDGQEKFIRNLTDWRDNAHNAQLTKGYLDLDKLRDSQYDGFTARMYPNQDNQAREYAVFDNSKVKMLEDVLANDDIAVNSAVEPPSGVTIAGKNRDWDELYNMFGKDAGAFENEDRTPITATPQQLRSEIQAIDVKYPDDLPDDVYDRRFALNQQLKAVENGYSSPYDYYVGESKKRFRQDFENYPDRYAAKIADMEKQAQAKIALEQDIADASPRKLAQFNIIQQKNPAPNATLTWIRSPKDIMTWDEAITASNSSTDPAFTWPDYTLEDALRDQKRGKMTVYSSYPVKGGTFVTPSRQQASDYAGGGRVYSKVIRPNDVAWINGDEGQYAYTRTK